MAIKIDNDKDLILIANKAGVEVETARKIFKSFSLHFVLKLLDKFDDEITARRESNFETSIDMSIDVKVPYLLDLLSIKISETDRADGRKNLNITSSASIAEFVMINIEQLLNGDEMEVRKMLKLQLLDSIIS